MLNGPQAMGDHDDRFLMEYRSDRVCHRIFGDAIQGTRRLIKNQHVRVAVQCPSDSDALSLPTTQLHPTLTHHGVIPVRQLLTNKLVQIGDSRCIPHSIHFDLFGEHTECNIRREAVVE